VLSASRAGLGWGLLGLVVFSFRRSRHPGRSRRPVAAPCRVRAGIDRRPACRRRPCPDQAALPPRDSVEPPGRGGRRHCRWIPAPVVFRPCHCIGQSNNYLYGVVGMPRPQALAACAIALLIHVIANPLVGAFSDRIGRRPVVLTGALGLTILSIPIFMLMSTGSFAWVLLGASVLAILVSFAGTMNVVLLVEVFPASIRSTGAALGHNVALALLAGPGPLVAASLVAAAGNTVAPAYYLGAVSLIALLVLWFMLPETKKSDISQG
jgi:hypothetical protein